MNHLVSVKDIHKRYGNTEALSGISLVIPKGRLLVYWVQMEVGKQP